MGSYLCELVRCILIWVNEGCVSICLYLYLYLMGSYLCELVRCILGWVNDGRCQHGAPPLAAAAPDRTLELVETVTKTPRQEHMNRALRLAPAPDSTPDGNCHHHQHQNSTARAHEQITKTGASTRQRTRGNCGSGVGKCQNQSSLADTSLGDNQTFDPRKHWEKDFAMEIRLDLSNKRSNFVPAWKLSPYLVVELRQLWQ